MRVYLVGGAVRDKLLGLEVAERDWVVVGATAAEMTAKGFRRLDRDFPVFAHPQTGEEYALARREIKVASGHKGFRVYTGLDVTLEEDLERRDLTINAMAQDEEGTLIDPFGGRDDLDNGFLRHVSPSFVEDPLRVLRVARFAARFARWGFRVAHRTHTLMKRMVESGELAELSMERVWRETKRALAEDQPVRYFEVLHRCGALRCLLPELERALGAAASHERSDEQTGASSALRALAVAARLSTDARPRWAALMHGLTSTRSARADEAGQSVLLQVAGRLRVERSFKELALLVHEHYGFFKTAAGAHADSLLAGLESLDALRRAARFEHFTFACQAIAMAEGWDPSNALQRLKTALSAVQAVSANELIAQGLEGENLAEGLRQKRVDAILARAPACHG